MTAPRPHPAPDDEAGFTLIEVLVALSILSLSLAVLLGIISEGLARTEDSNHALAARALARSLLEQARLSAAPANGGISGDTADGLHWTVARSPFVQSDDSHATLHAAVLTVTVSWDEGRRSLALKTLQFVPEGSNR